MIVQTRNTRYVLQDKGDGIYRISGHARFCPVPTDVRLWWEPKVGNYMAFEYLDHAHPQYNQGTHVRTSEVMEVTLEDELAGDVRPRSGCQCEIYETCAVCRRPQ
jgi:hypothetical protein